LSPLNVSKPKDTPLGNAPRASATIVIDALAARYGGTAWAATEVADRLADDAVGGEVVVVTRAQSLIAETLAARSGLRLLLLADVKRFELARRVFWEAYALPRLVRQEGASSVLTWSGMLPRSVGVSVVCYLANSAIMERRDVGNRLRRWAARRTARRAACVLVPTEAAAARVAEVVGRAPEVVPLGVDHTHFRPASALGSDVLCVADFYRHKRHDLLLDAWAALPAPRPRLRLIGNPGVDRQWHRTITGQVEALRGAGEIVLESWLPRDQLLFAYRGARVLALGSEQESFCLPLVEAQACGVPALVRDTPVLRETGGEGTTYVDGDDPHEWAAALQRLITDDDAHASARAAGLDHASGYSWERTASAVRSWLSKAGSESVP
jgi:glycosyltransferase involved in cell wall biosynthesis